MDSFVLAESLVILLVLFLGLFGSCVLRGSARHLPPGPKPLPIIGNLLDIPKETDEEYIWKSWANQRGIYGPICSVVVFGQIFLIINDKKTAYELLEKKSNIYCDRPTLTFGRKMCGYENILGMQPYQERFKLYRKLLFQFMGTKSLVSQYYPIIESQARHIMKVWLDRPDQLEPQLRRSSGATILRLAYGYIVNPSGRDPFLEEADEALERFSIACDSSRWLVDTLPFLQYLPVWFPGASFKKTARLWRQALFDVAERPFTFVKKQAIAHQAKESYASKMLENIESEEDEFVAKWSATSLYLGGVDTTSSTLYGFFLAMVLYPLAQKRAQDEIDSIIGQDRLPAFADRDSLPYVNALIKEVFRWNTITPMSIPHSSVEDDIYEGYHIPKGSILIPNVWQFHNDPDTYHEPDTFKPERFLEDGGQSPEPDPRNTAFGFGRRACPGRELAEASIFITVAMTLAVYKIGKALDANGNEITPSKERTRTLLSTVKRFPCSLKVRSSTTEALVRAAEGE